MKHETRFAIAGLLLVSALTLGAARAAEPADVTRPAPEKSMAGPTKKMSNTQRWKAAIRNADRRAAAMRRHAQGRGR